MMPVQQLLSPNEGVMNALSGLSIEQLNSMEETLRRAKMDRQQSFGNLARVPPSAPPRPSARLPPARAPTASMKQFMSVMNTTPKSPSPPKPSIKIVNGVPWLTFTYTTRSAASTPYTVRANIDQVSMDDIPAKFQETNCLYPSANGVEEEYKGSRRDYERECNEQGWKLAHLNPTVLSERKGVLQRAVISLRNASSEQKSRRVKSQEKKTQSKAVEKDVRGPVLLIPRLIIPSNSPVPAPLPLTWQPAMVSSLQDGTQRPVPSDLTPRQQPEAQVQTATPQLTQRLPSLGSFETSTSDLSSLEFDGYIQGQFKRLRLQINISGINLDDIPHEFKRSNCVYPRSFLTHDDQSEHWNTYGIRQAEESFLNEIGWKLCLINSGLLNGKRLLLQQVLDAYRRRFLPSTGQPRARVGPSLLTRRNSSSSPVYSLFSGSDPPRTRHRNQQARVRFDTGDPISRKEHVEVAGEPYSEDDEGMDKASNRYGSAERRAADENGDEEDDEEYGEEGEEDSDDSKGEDFDEEDGDEDEEPSEGDSFEDESGDGSSSEEVFHSQMSLLSFTGSIRTYSLGTGSGSARSRPRIHSTTAATASSKNASPLSRSETFLTRKRSWNEFTPKTYPNSGGSGSNHRVRFDKRIRHGDTEGDRDALGYEQHGHEDGREPDGKKREGREGAGVAVEDGGRKENESEQEGYHDGEDEDEDEGEGDNEDEDEVDWWKSRLNNSEYAEDHNLVSMTTEELIGALTNCYNSDVEDYYEDED
ncbi:hypothetical protein KI688_010846 [Linnemannia hyalina]|uniref:DUF8032 domain-containing protein n=1 Tax=Linnemannia hyalina TaxID=64524 RepID=A0A9P7XWS3_9FUNG|nr:hypothetical protein KI688_010846 [Linnemannia hyalina]